METRRAGGNEGYKMKKMHIRVNSIYYMKYYKTMTRPVKVLKLGTYKAEIQCLDTKTLQPIPVPNPAVWGATTELVPFSHIINRYEVAA